MIAGYLGPDVDVVPGAPDADLVGRTCDRCGMLSCPAVADVSWTVRGPSGEEVREGVIVGSECITPTVAQAREQVVDGGTISVDVPLWTAEQVRVFRTSERAGVAA